MTESYAIDEKDDEAEYIFSSVHFLDGERIPLAKAIYITRQRLLRQTLFTERWDTEYKKMSGIRDKMIWKKDGLPDITGFECDKSGKIINLFTEEVNVR